MKSSSSCLIFVFVLVSQYVCPSEQFEMDSIGRVVRGHLGTLYDLRSKLGSSSSSATVSTTTATPAVHHYKSQKQHNNSLKKESRGYAFHYSSSDISHPMYSASTSFNQDFQSRMGKVSDSPSTSNNKWKNSDKGMDKYAKLAYKTGSKDAALNSFNIHQKAIDYNETTSPEVKTTSLPIISPTTPTTAIPIALNLAPLKTLSQGLNSAVTQVLTQKLMNLLDQDVPQGILNPFRHLVASGNRMVEFWDKRTVARDGKTPGIVEMLGFGLDQLKKFRDGQELRSSDNVSNLTSASKTLIQGMLVVKKLTNRVLGYDTDEAAIESRGGYGGGDGGGGGWGWGQQMSMGQSGGLDPFSLLAALAFAAFLLQLLMVLLSSSARSLDVVDLNTPMLMSDFHIPNFMKSADKIFGTPTVRTKRSARGEESTFDTIVDKLDGVVKVYQQISEKPKCSRLYLCRIAVQDAMGDEKSVLAKLYMFGLGHLSKDKSASQFVKSIQSRVADGEDVNCDKIVKECIPKELE
ncbi:unnamed protein product [Allacma fusca]|uniref:Uncharacterized protein n=1 Tax=Allacma fusca TaxID=39272 RepID=A0A8J2LNV6_9HEXA|nr:unnamed protein product [Allacma fusca]